MKDHSFFPNWSNEASYIAAITSACLSFGKVSVQVSFEPGSILFLKTESLTGITLDSCCFLMVKLDSWQVPSFTRKNLTFRFSPFFSSNLKEKSFISSFKSTQRLSTSPCSSFTTTSRWASFREEPTRTLYAFPYGRETSFTSSVHRNVCTAGRLSSLR